MSRRRLAVILGHEWRLATRDPVPAMVLVLFPIITMAFLKPAFRAALVQGGFPHANGAEQVVPGQAVVSAFFIVSLTTFAFFSEYGWMTWDRLRASPATSMEIVLGKSIPRVAMVVAQFVVVLAIGVLLFNLNIRGNPLALIPLVLMFSISLVLLGVAVTAVCRTMQQANAFAYVGMVLFGAIGGALVPFNVLPHWAQTVAPATPTYWAMRGFESVILDGRGLSAMAAPVGALAAMTLLFTLVALRRLRFAEMKTGWQ
jgi:ABC-2 type transport system permease protein